MQLGCVSQDTNPPKKSILRKSGKLGSSRAATFSKGTAHHKKILEKKGSPQGVDQKCEPEERNPNFEDRTLQESLQQRRCARRDAWDLAKKCL